MIPSLENDFKILELGKKLYLLEFGFSIFLNLACVIALGNNELKDFDCNGTHFRLN